MNFQPRALYTKTARFDGTARALTEDEIRANAPSVFAVTAHESRSEKFRPIPTIEVIRALAAEGFSVVGARQSTTRDESKKDFTKHLLRLRRLDDKALKVNDSVFEILLKNANDGTSAYDLMYGLFRIQCLNSLVAQTSNIDTVKVRHSGDVAGKVIEGTYQVLKDADKLLTAPADWSALNMSRDEQALFATAAHGLRFDDEEDGRAHPIQASTLLVPRRNEDFGKDLWTTFNVVQENAIRGGLHGKRIDAETGRRRRVTTRPINGIDQDVKLNKALWVLAEGMAKLKTAN